jgi:hypothetical protein
VQSTEQQVMPSEIEVPDFVDKIFLEEKWLLFKALVGGDSLDSAIKNLE